MQLEKKEKKRAANARQKANRAARKNAEALQAAQGATIAERHPYSRGQPARNNQSSQRNPGIYMDPQSHSSGPAYSQVSTPRTPLGYGQGPQTPYSQQGSYPPCAQLGYGQSPQTPWSQQAPLQSVSSSQINAMQASLGAMDLSRLDEGMRQLIAKEIASQMVPRR